MVQFQQRTDITVNMEAQKKVCSCLSKDTKLQAGMKSGKY